MSADRPKREYDVFPGEPDDACPLCGIHRLNAGYIKRSCGEGFRKPGCFVRPDVERKEPQP